MLCLIVVINRGFEFIQDFDPPMWWTYSGDVLLAVMFVFNCCDKLCF